MIQTQQSDFRSSAFHWYGFGLNVIPVIPGKKQTAVKWDDWLDGLCPESINDHWDQTYRS